MELSRHQDLLEHEYIPYWIYYDVLKTTFA